MANQLNVKYNGLNERVSNGSSSDLLFTTALAIFAGGGISEEDDYEEIARHAYERAIVFLDVSKEMFDV